MSVENPVEKNHDEEEIPLKPLEEKESSQKDEKIEKKSKEIKRDSRNIEEVSEENKETDVKSREKQLEFTIRSAKDFRELYHVLQESEGIQGSGKLYTPDELLDLVSRVGGGENPNILTSKMGLREKVIELQEIEKLKKELGVEGKDKLQRLLRDIDLNLEEYKFRLKSGNLDPDDKAKLEEKITDLEKRKKEAEGQLN